MSAQDPAERSSRTRETGCRRHRHQVVGRATELQLIARAEERLIAFDQLADEIETMRLVSAKRG